VALVMTKKMTVEVPICDRHRGYWWKRILLMVLPLFLLLAVGLGLFALMEEVEKGSGGLACIASGGLLFVWIIVFAIVQNRMIRPAEITDQEITLNCVHEDFVVAFEQRGRRSRRPRRRDYDDDDDDFEPYPRRRPKPVDDEHRESFRADPKEKPQPPDDRDTFRAGPENH